MSGEGKKAEGQKMSIKGKENNEQGKIEQKKERVKGE